jgi:hypothetical protein
VLWSIFGLLQIQESRVHSKRLPNKFLEHISQPFTSNLLNDIGEYGVPFVVVIKLGTRLCPEREVSDVSDNIFDCPWSPIFFKSDTEVVVA